MLVLTRKTGESFGVGENIVITVVSINRGKVRIGIKAPRHVPVVRDDAKAKTPRWSGEVEEIRTPDQRVTFLPEGDQIG